MKVADSFIYRERFTPISGTAKCTAFILGGDLLLANVSAVVDVRVLHVVARAVELGADFPYL